MPAEKWLVVPLVCHQGDRSRVEATQTNRLRLRYSVSSPGRRDNQLEFARLATRAPSDPES